MKQVLFFLILFLAFHIAISQDTVVTTKGDTIDCKITRVTDEFIHFSVFDKSGILLMRSRIPLVNVQHYEQSTEEQKEEPSPPVIPVEDRIILDEFEPSLIRLSLNTGYTHQFEGYDYWPDAYKNQLQSLWYLGSDVHYFPSETLGVGLKYNFIFTNAEGDFDPQIYNISTIRDERVRFSYAAVSLMYRNFLYDDQVVQYFISGGVVTYKTDGKVDGFPFYQEGDTFGLGLGVSYDFILVESFGIGVGAEVNIARLTEFDNNGTIVPADFGLNRIDLTVGLRFFK
ncbi:hypothetical protein SAMN05421640_3319 [Ekhidna lutea]|uniref:Outer membrane protein beta-barrel domain-containing protein n=1 Tax=Ekhidna lutea TaxID=447679 RepID=A0A239LM42_EKHLU|nr:hypothetical protein [Ekhidna lutea]SNT30644.1 hypothetical protein SAMN05421640_3319 [Ekhidna lutea]